MSFFGSLFGGIKDVVTNPLVAEAGGEALGVPGVGAAVGGAKSSGDDLFGVPGLGSLIGPLLGAGVKTFGDINAAQTNEDLTHEKWAHDDAKAAQDTLLKLQLEQLKAMYGSGGGGSPGNHAAMTDAQKLAAMQSAKNAKLDVLKNLIGAYGAFK